MNIFRELDALSRSGHIDTRYKSPSVRVYVVPDDLTKDTRALCELLKETKSVVADSQVIIHADGRAFRISNKSVKTRWTSTRSHVLPRVYFHGNLVDS